METVSAEYDRIFRRLDFYFALTGYRLTAMKPKTALSGLISNWFLWVIGAIGVFYGYLSACEKSDRSVVVQQFYGFCCSLYCILNATCQQICWDETQQLLAWFKEVLTHKYPLEYEKIVHNKFKRIINIIGLIVKFYPILFIPILFIFNLKPFFVGERTLQFPVVINGNSAKDFPVILFSYIYIHLLIGGIVIVASIVSNQIFVMICVIYLRNQFEIIIEIMRMLNYDGVRDRQRDKRIIQDCYMLHLEVIEKCNIFKRYINLYGLYTLGVPLINSSLMMFNLAEYGFSLMSFTSYVASFCMIIILCVFSEILAGCAERLPEAIYLLNWEDLNVTEQKQILLMLSQSQMGMQLTAGNHFILNFNLITKIAQLQASICALVQNV